MFARCKKHFQKYKKSITIVCTMGFVISLTVVISLKSTNDMKNISYHGVSWRGVDVGGLNSNELSPIIHEIVTSSLEKKKFNLVFDNEVRVLGSSDLGLYYSEEEIIENIISYQKTGNLFKDTINRFILRLSPKNIDTAIPYIDKKILDKSLKKLNKEVSIPAKEAIPTFKKDSLTLSKSKNGITIDIKELKKSIINEVNKLNFSSNVISIDVPMKVVYPKLSSNLETKMSILGSFSTKLPSLNSNRTSNIRLFSRKLNKTVVSPGEEFSADKTAGSREAKDGYKPAAMYSNNNVVDGIAGGICQATSTLYNALLYADMDITQRAPHSKTVTYVSKALDAAIAKGQLDLRFINNTSNPVIIELYVSPNGYVVSNIWGVNENPNKKIKLRVINHNSKSATSYKDVYENGKLIKTSILNRDTYK